MGRHDRIKLVLPKYKPKYVAIKGKTGEVYQGRRGKYQVLSIGKDTIEVLYLDGEWKDKQVTMSKVTHNIMQQNIPIEVAVTTSQKLDWWWEKYPTVYMEEWNEEITSKELLDRLEMKYPTQAESISKILGIGD